MLATSENDSECDTISRLEDSISLLGLQYAASLLKHLELFYGVGIPLISRRRHLIEREGSDLFALKQTCDLWRLG